MFVCLFVCFLLLSFQLYSAGGDVKIWDPRFTKPIKSISGLPSSVNVCEVHPRSPMLACASPQHAIRVYNLESEDMLNHIRYHDGFMGQKIGPTKCLAFHPYKVWFLFDMCSRCYKHFFIGLVGSRWYRWTYCYLLYRTKKMRVTLGLFYVFLFDDV